MDIKIIGLDIGRGSAVACVMETRPTDLPDFIRKYKPLLIAASPEGLRQLLELGDIFALEPTGKDHRWWQRSLESAGRQVLLTAGVRIRNHARGQGVLSKGDKEDAAVVADYTMLHLERGNVRAFQSNAGSKAGDLRISLLSVHNHRGRLINQLKARLAEELPEQAKFVPTDRKWLEPSPKCWQTLSELPLSWESREDIQQIIYWNERERRLEGEFDALTSSSEFDRYRSVWGSWNLKERQIVAIIGAIHPIEQFLSEDGNRVIEHQHTKDGNRVKCDRTLRGIHRALGYGRIKYQSGDSWKWKRTGDGSIISALYVWIKMMVVIRRMPTARELAKRYELPENFKELSKKKRTAWMEAHNFRAFCLEAEPQCDTVRPIPRDGQRVGFMPWKDQALIQKVCEFNGASARVAQLQLYYEWGFFEIRMHDRILKTLPLMIRLLVEDLIT